MRKGTTLLLLTAMALAAACLSASGQVFAEALEPTDSGAPAAIVIFPVGEKPGPLASGMPPVAFNHVVHEKWMNRTKKDCLVCHHTGDPVACTTCHTVEGSADGNFVTLDTAMHSKKIAKRKENTPSSCVSCHENALKQRDCAGCHTQLVRIPAGDTRSCTVCHTISPSMTLEQFKQGTNNSLPETQNTRLAEETALARKPVSYWSPMLAPYKVKIDTLASQYQPAIFNHRHHVASMMERIKDNRLAGAFHTDPGTVCSTCHHRSPITATPPKCSNCHTKNIDPMNPGKPRLEAAFHRQCMNCHTDMKVARPRNTDCETCHKPLAVRGSGN